MAGNNGATDIDNPAFGRTFGCKLGHLKLARQFQHNKTQLAANEFV